jgi:hypothetical protein
MGRHLEVLRCRAFADARRGVVARSVAGAEIPAELALDLTLALRSDNDLFAQPDGRFVGRPPVL